MEYKMQYEQAQEGWADLLKHLKANYPADHKRIVRLMKKEGNIMEQVYEQGYHMGMRAAYGHVSKQLEDMDAKKVPVTLQ